MPWRHFDRPTQTKRIRLPTIISGDISSPSFRSLFDTFSWWNSKNSILCSERKKRKRNLKIRAENKNNLFFLKIQKASFRLLLCLLEITISWIACSQAGEPRWTMITKECTVALCVGSWCNAPRASHVNVVDSFSLCSYFWLVGFFFVVFKRLWHIFWLGLLPSLFISIAAFSHSALICLQLCLFHHLSAPYHLVLFFFFLHAVDRLSLNRFLLLNA